MKQKIESAHRIRHMGSTNALVWQVLVTLYFAVERTLLGSRSLKMFITFRYV